MDPTTRMSRFMKATSPCASSSPRCCRTTRPGSFCYTERVKFWPAFSDSSITLSPTNYRICIPRRFHSALVKNVTFFEVRCAKEDAYWISETPRDKHLKAYFGVAAEPLINANNRFYVVTTVFYKHWTGPVYFNLIRPFHHLVVSRMAHAGLKNRPAGQPKQR